MHQDHSHSSELTFRAFIRTYGLFRHRMQEYFSQFGITGAQWGILRALHRAEGEDPGGLRLTDLGRRLLVRPPSVTTIVDRLERMGLVARKSAIKDQRVKTVTLTRAGRQIVARILEHHPQQIHTILAGLSKIEQ